MSRPKPKVILEHHDTTNYKTEQVLAAASVYSVFFQGAPINLRTQHSYLNYPGPKYKKTSFKCRVLIAAGSIWSLYFF